MSDDEHDPEPLRRRGLIGGGFVAWPVAICWVVALVTTLVIGRTQRADLLPYFATLYACTGFFAHGYMVAWRAGTFLRRMFAMLIAVALFAALAWLHADDAAAREVYVFGTPYTRGAEPAWFIAVAADSIAATLLFVHGFVLGFGSRAARAVRHAMEHDAEPDADAEPIADGQPPGADGADEAAGTAGATSEA